MMRLEIMSDIVFRMNCWFEGHVQGVGFRYETLNIAKGFEVTGTVRNLLDGRVQLCAEGDETEVLAFQREIELEMESYIRKSEVQTEIGPRIHKGFKIVH